MPELHINIFKVTSGIAMNLSQSYICMDTPSYIGQGHKVIPELHISRSSQLHWVGPENYARITHKRFSSYIGHNQKLIPKLRMYGCSQLH